MNTIAAKLLASVAEKAGEKVLQKVLQEYGGESGQKLSESLFGGSETREIKEEIIKQVDKISQQLTDSFDVTYKMLDFITKLNLFGAYNDRVYEINKLLDAYDEYIEKSLKDSPDKRNLYEDILSRNGIIEKVRLMITYLKNKDNKVIHKSLLEYLASELLKKYTDVFDFCSQLDSIVNHARFYIITAIILEDTIRKEAEEHNNSGENKIEIGNYRTTSEYIKKFEEFYYEIVKDAKIICSQFDECQGVPIMLQHLPDQKYLTGYGGGSAESEDNPFAPSIFELELSPLESSAFGVGLQLVLDRNPASLREKFFYNPRTGTPQIFLNGLLPGQEDKEFLRIFKQKSGSHEYFKEQDHTRLKTEAQRWKLIKKKEDGIIYFIFQHQASGLVLDGISSKGKVYLGKLDDNNSHLKWQPIVTEHPKPYKHENGYFILRHLHQRGTLDSDGSRVYAGEPVDAGKSETYHGNIYIKWRLVTDTLFPGEFLEPSQKLLSMNGKISLTYDKESGVLVLFDRAENKELWKSRQGQLGAWRCCMQEDGNFVTYAKENVPTWASNTMKPGGRLIVRDSGDLVITAQNGNTIWSSLKSNIRLM